MADISKIKTPDGVVYNLRDDRFSEYLKNFEESSDNTPYLYRPTGDGIEDIGNYESLDKIVGGTVCWNQLQANTVSKVYNGVTYTFSDGKLTVVSAEGGATANGWWLGSNNNKWTFTTNHVYLVDVGNEDYSFTTGSYIHFYIPLVPSININRPRQLIKITAGGDSYLQYVVYEGNEVNTTYAPQVFDLTQMFGSTIADYIYSLETATAGAGVAWFKKLFPKDYYEYNPGELISVSGLQSHEMVGFNLWDEEWEEGTFNTTTGENLSVSNQIRSKNIIKILPNTTYYWASPVYNWTILYDANGNVIPTPNITDTGSDARSGNSFSISARHTFTTPANAYGMRFYTGTYTPPYNNNIALNLSWSGTRNGEYEPYKKNSYPLDSTLTLRGIPKLDSNNDLYYDGDEYLPDGTVTRKYGVVDLGTLSWTYYEPLQRMYSLNLRSIISNGSKWRAFCGLYPYSSSGQDKTLLVGTDGTVYIYDSSYTDTTAFKTAMSGIMLIYELATPTTETADPYQQVQQVDSWGTEEFTDAGVVAETRDVAIPVGHETRYLAKSNYFPEFNSNGNGTYAIKQTGDQMSLSPITLQQIQPLATHTYTNVIATANSNQGGGFFYLKVRGDTYNTKWYIKTRVLATVPGQELYETDTTFELWGYANTYSGYACMNKIKTTSYRPIYYNSYFRVSETGYNNNCGGWIGFNLVYATNQTNTSYKRNIVVELLDYQNCEVELQDDLIIPDNIPERATHTNWYSSTNTSYDNFDACTQGLRQSGDSNTTSISNLYYYNGNYIADSPLYRFQLLFHVDDDRLTPLNNNNNVTGITKTMLTDVEFNPFKDIFYYYSTTTINKDANIDATNLFYSVSGIDLRYSFNITTSAFTIHKDVYLVVTPTTNNKVKLASADPLTQELPTNDDGYWYLLLGRTYNAYCISLHPKHPIYAYKDDKIVTINPSNVYFNDTEIKPLLKKIDSTNIIHIEDAAEKPLKECTVNIEPTQDLHGYDYPWPAGDGKNKMPNAIPKTETINGITFKLDDFGIFTVTGTATAAASCNFPIGFSFVIPDGDPKPKFVLHNTQNTSASFGFYNNSTYIDSWGMKTVNRVSEYSGMRGKICNSYSISVPSGATIDMTISPMIVENSVTDYTYAPYSNICPITGLDSVTVSRTGKNLCPSFERYNTTNYVSSPIFLKAGKQYTVSFESDIIPNAIYLRKGAFNTASGQYIYNTKQWTFTPNESRMYLFQFYQSGTGWDNHVFSNLQLELGSTATEYEPYQGQTYDITFPTGAGTVYGGSLDVTNGMLTVNRTTVDLGTLTWTWNDANGWIAPFSGGLKPMVNNSVAMNAICSTMPVVSKTENNSIVTAGTNLDTIAATWQGTYLYGSNANAMPTGILVYELATPITYTLTLQEITTLLGTNNIWADTGNMSCTYYVNSQLNTELNNYIPKSLGTAEGDIIYYSDNNTPNRLGIGSQGQVLKVNSNGIPAWGIAANNAYGECATTGNTAAKLVTITGFELTTGVSVHIKFSYANTATTPTLNISNTGAKTIIWNKECTSPWSANEIITLTYDGTYWVVNNCNKIPVVRLI